MANRRSPWDFDPFALAALPVPPVPENDRHNLRNAIAFSPADEAWWQEYGVAMDAFHDKMQRLDLPKSR